MGALWKIYAAAPANGYAAPVAPFRGKLGPIPADPKP